MIKYQLERIKDMYSGISDPDRLDGIPVVTVAQSDIEWLIQQAERAQEYDRELISLEDNKHYVSEMLAKNKRYREAIERALDESGWGDEGNALYRTIGILTKALEGEE